MHVVDNIEIRSTLKQDNTGSEAFYDEVPSSTSLLTRGRSMRRRVYNPDRLRYPMKRVG